MVGIAAATLGVLPLFTSFPAPLQDWPAHLARVFMLDQLLRGVGPWAAFYDFNTFLLPNVALDLGVLGLLRAGLNLAQAGAVFLLATYALFVTGFIRMSRGFGAAHPATPVLGALLFYNCALFFGLVNYLSAFGPLFWTVGLWLRSERAAVRLSIAVLGTAATFACHLVPAMALVGVLGVLDISALVAVGWRRFRYHATSLASAVTVLALLKLSPAGGNDVHDVVYGGAGSIRGFVWWKLGIFAKALLGGGLWPDVVTGVVAVVVILLVLVLARLTLPRISLAVIAAVTALTLLAPQRIGTGSLLDYRLAIVPYFFAAATIRFRWRVTAAPSIAFVVIVSGLLIRTAVQAVSWHAASVIYAEADNAYARLPSGSVLLTAMGRPTTQIPWFEYWTPAINHLDTLAVEHEIFVPTVFASRLQQPLALKDFAREWILAADASTPVLLDQLLARARRLCPQYPGVFIAALYPTPFMRGEAVNDRLSIIDACAP